MLAQTLREKYPKNSVFDTLHAVKQTHIRTLDYFASWKLIKFLVKIKLKIDFIKVGEKVMLSIKKAW